MVLQCLPFVLHGELRTVTTNLKGHKIERASERERERGRGERERERKKNKSVPAVYK